MKATKANGWATRSIVESIEANDPATEGDLTTRGAMVEVSKAKSAESEVDPTGSENDFDAGEGDFETSRVDFVASEVDFAAPSAEPSRGRSGPGGTARFTSE